MALGKPDVTKFDSDDDSIKDARPEFQTAFTSLNTMIDEYNANGDTFGGKKESYIHEINSSTTVDAVDNYNNIFLVKTAATITLNVHVDQLSATGIHRLFFEDALGVCNVVVSYGGSAFGQRTFQLVGGTSSDNRLIEVYLFEVGDSTSDSAGSRIAMRIDSEGQDFVYFT